MVRASFNYEWEDCNGDRDGLRPVGRRRIEQHIHGAIDRRGQYYRARS